MSSVSAFSSPSPPFSMAISQLAIMIRTSSGVPANSDDAALSCASASAPRSSLWSTSASMMKTVALSWTDTGIVFLRLASSSCRVVRGLRTPGSFIAASSSVRPPSRLPSSTLHCALMMEYIGDSRTLKLLATASSRAACAATWSPLERWILESTRCASAHAGSISSNDSAVRTAASCAPATYRVRISSSCAESSPGALPQTASISAVARSIPGLIGSPLPLGSPLSCDRYSSAHCSRRSGSMWTK